MGVGLRPAAVKMFESASSCRSSSSSSSTRHRSCYCLWKVALVTLVAFMANVCDIVRALQEQQAESRGRLLLVNDESTAIITAASASSAAAVGEDGDEGEDKEGDGPNTRIAKTVEYWLPFAMGGILFLFLLGCFVKSIYRATRRARDEQADDGKNEERLERNHSSPWRNPSIRDHQLSEHSRSHSSRKKSGEYYLPSLYIPAQNGHSSTSSSNAYRSHRDDTKWTSPIDVSKAMRSSFSGGVSGSIHDPHRSYRSSSSAIFPSERSPPPPRRPAEFDVGVFYSNRVLEAGELGRENGNSSVERSLSLKSTASVRNLGHGRSSNKINTMVLSASLSEGLFVGDELQGKKAPGEKGDVHMNPMAKHVGSGAARSSDPVAASSVDR